MIRAIDIPWWRSGTVIALAALTIWLCRESAPPNISPESGVIMDLPTLVGEYWGTSETVSPSELALLPGDTEFEKKIYQDLTGNSLTAQVVLSGGEKRSIHRPEVCLPGQGWSVQAGEVLPITLANGRTLDVMKLTLNREIETGPGQRVNLKSYFLYWFVGKDTSTPHHWVRLAKTKWDMVVKKAPASLGLRDRQRSRARRAPARGQDRPADSRYAQGFHPPIGAEIPTGRNALRRTSGFVSSRARRTSSTRSTPPRPPGVSTFPVTSTTGQRASTPPQRR